MPATGQKTGLSVNFGRHSRDALSHRFEERLRQVLRAAHHRGVLGILQADLLAQFLKGPRPLGSRRSAGKAIRTTVRAPLAHLAFDLHLDGHDLRNCRLEWSGADGLAATKRICTPEQGRAGAVYRIRLLRGGADAGPMGAHSD